MARKNVFGNDTDTAAPDHVAPERSAPSAASRPLLGLDRPLRQGSPLGAISQSLDAINAKVKRAETIERALTAGQAVVELDPAVVDGAFVSDRMEGSDEQHQLFLDAIRTHGQQVPILVRPKPGAPDRFEVAYGHRRLRAARDLGRTVRAVVRVLSDEELVVAQGQENSARTDLTFIERARFAARLEDRKFTRDTIMAALNVDKAALSRLIALASRVPPDVIEAIGPAPAYGRVRWQELVERLDADERVTQARTVIATPAFKALASDQRFERLHAALRESVPRPAPEPWIARDGTRLATISRAGHKVSIAFDERVAPDFGGFVRERLQEIYDEYKSLAFDKSVRPKR